MRVDLFWWIRGTTATERVYPTIWVSLIGNYSWPCSDDTTSVFGMTMSSRSSFTCGSELTLIDLPSTSGLDLAVWESAAKQILRDYDIRDIQLLYRFSPPKI